MPTSYHYRLHCSPTRLRSRGNLCVHIISLQTSLFADTLKKVEWACVSTPYYTSFIVRRNALEVEGTCVPTSYHYSFIVHEHALEVEGTCVSAPYHYRLHCSPTRFRSRGNLCAHIISLLTSLFAHTL